jgi:hypothetical protein
MSARPRAFTAQTLSSETTRPATPEGDGSGGLAGGTAGAALAGGAIGAVAGGVIADVTRPGWCYYWRNHRRHYVRC